MSDALTEHLRSFQTWLQDAGFRLIAGLENLPSADNLWVGIVSVEWPNSSTGSSQVSEHKVAVLLPPGFPYRAPIVVCRDEPPLAPSWHLSPGLHQVLCLWDSRTGWRPHYSAQRLLERIADWFYYYHTDTWPSASEMPDLHRYLPCEGLVVIGEDWSPSDNRRNGGFTFWRHRDHSKTYPCLASCQEDAVGSTTRNNRPEDRLIRALFFDLQKSRKYSGVWFRLAKPFVPPENLGELFKLIDIHSDSEQGTAEKTCLKILGQDLADPGFPLSIGYTDNYDQERWLFLWVQLPNGGRRKHGIPWSKVGSLSEIRIASFQTAPAGKDALLRRSAYLSKQLSTCKVVVFGVGALGSSIALLLAKAGVGEIRLVDEDILMPGNAMRHVCGIDLVGVSKTNAVRWSIGKHNPDCNVVCYDSTWEFEKLSSYTEGCDIAIDATADHNFSLYLNEVCLELSRVIIFAAAYRRATIGRVIVHRGDDDPCLACYANAERFWQEHDYPIIPPAPGNAFIEDGCGVVTEEAVALDVEAVANLTVRTAIKVLQGQLGSRNLAILVNEKNADVEGILAQEGVHWRSNKPLAQCSICRNKNT